MPPAPATVPVQIPLVTEVAAAPVATPTPAVAKPGPMRSLARSASAAAAPPAPPAPPTPVVEAASTDEEESAESDEGEAAEGADPNGDARKRRRGRRGGRGRGRARAGDENAPSEGDAAAPLAAAPATDEGTKE